MYSITLLAVLKCIKLQGRVVCWFTIYLENRYVKSGRFRSQCEKSLGCRWQMRFSGVMSLGRLA